MKKLGLLFGFCFILMGASAQNGNLVIFSDEGTKFFLVVNGLRINDQALSNVRLTDLNYDYVKAKIVFENDLIPDIDKNTLMLQRGYEVSYVVKKNKKGETVCNWYSSVELAQAPVNNANQQTIVYSSVPPNDGVVIRTGIAGTTTTTTTTTTSGNPNTVNANVDMNGVGVNVSIYDGTSNMNGTTTTTYSSTTTTTTSNTDNVNYTNSNANNNCIYGMSETDFRAAKNSISSGSFEDTKSSTFKQIVSSKCVNTKQVKEMLQLFTFEETKLEMAKYAYSYVADPSNYYTINDIFTFDSSKDELSNYVMSNKRN